MPAVNVSFCKWKHSFNTVTFHSRECKMNIESCRFFQRCHARCHKNRIQDFHLMLYLNIFFWLKNRKNTDRYITKLSSLSSARECDDDPEGTLFSWFGPILFLPHQRNIMNDSWVLAMNHICKSKKTCLYVHKKN